MLRGYNFINQRGDLMSERTFTPEFKRELVLDHGYTITQACKATGVGSTTMRRWTRPLQAERDGGLIFSIEARSTFRQPYYS
jgi:transposase-like protein